MKNKLIWASGAMSAVSLLLISCAMEQPATVASMRRNRMPPAQNVHTWDGGSMVLDLQQRGGQGVQEGSGSGTGIIGGGH